MSFFFQAEDGIRDHCVTGVQTCALPIYLSGDPGQVILRRTVDGSGRSRCFINGHAATLAQLKEAGEYLVDIHGQHLRSEERRVGKECRSRWSPYEEKQRTQKRVRYGVLR